MPKAVIFDIDFTLLKPSDKPFKDHTVEPIQKNIDMLNMMHEKGFKILIVTGRHNDLHDITTKELHDAGIKYDRLIMNNLVIKGQKQQGYLFKEQEIKRLQKEYDVVAAVDDDEKALNAYRDAGVHVHKS